MGLATPRWLLQNTNHELPHLRYAHNIAIRALDLAEDLDHRY